MSVPRIFLLALCLSLVAAAGCDGAPRAHVGAAPGGGASAGQSALAAGQRAYAQTDFAGAFKRFHEAAAQGNADAQYYLGVMYADGQGTQRNYPEAVRWYEKAAAQNHPDALYALARLYVTGLGVEADASRAVELYGRAAAAYPPGAQRDQAEQQRQALAAVLDETKPAKR